MSKLMSNLLFPSHIHHVHIMENGNTYLHIVSCFSKSLVKNLLKCLFFLMHCNIGNTTKKENIHVICSGTKMRALPIRPPQLFYSHVICSGTKISNLDAASLPLRLDRIFSLPLFLLYHICGLKKSYFWLANRLPPLFM